MLKIKDSGIKIKVDVAKLLNDTIKQNGDVQKAVENYTGGDISDDMDEIRRLIVEKKTKENGE